MITSLTGTGPCWGCSSVTESPRGALIADVFRLRDESSVGGFFMMQADVVPLL